MLKLMIKKSIVRFFIVITLLFPFLAYAGTGPIKVSLQITATRTSSGLLSGNHDVSIAISNGSQASSPVLWTDTFKSVPFYSGSFGLVF